MLRTILPSWNASIEYAAKDRLGTRHKVSFIMEQPKRYVDVIRQRFKTYERETAPGVKFYGQALVHESDATQTPIKVLRDILRPIDRAVLGHAPAPVKPLPRLSHPGGTRRSP